MKHLLIALMGTVAVVATAAEPAKAPGGSQNRVETPAPPAKPASAPETKFAKKKSEQKKEEKPADKPKEPAKK